MIQESNKNHPGTAMVNVCPGNTIRGTFICSDPQKAQIKRTIICSNCKNPLDVCAFCGHGFKLGNIVHCSILNSHFCKKCAEKIQKDHGPKLERKKARK